MSKKTGTKIKEARTQAGLTQEQLAKKIKGVTASDISKAERGELDLTQAVLKEIAKATGVTQTSLLNADKASSSAKSGKSTGSSKKESTGAKKTASSKTGSKTSSVKLTAAEKKLIELYREADSDTKKEVVKILKGETTEANEMIGELLSGAMELLGGLK